MEGTIEELSQIPEKSLYYRKAKDVIDVAKSKYRKQVLMIGIAMIDILCLSINHTIYLWI